MRCLEVLSERTSDVRLHQQDARKKAIESSLPVAATSGQ